MTGNIYEIPEDYIVLKERLYAASVAGDVEGVEAVLERCGRLLDCRFEEGFTPFLLAVSKGHLALAKYLIARGASLDAETTYARHNALFHAIESEAYDMIRAMLEAGVDATVRDCNDYIPLSYVLSNFDGAYRMRVMRLLLKHHGDVSFLGEDADKLFERACYVKERTDPANGELLDLLLAHGASLETRNFYGQTHLLRAVSERRIGVVRALLERGADLNGRVIAQEPPGQRAWRRGDGYTAVHVAVEQGDDEILTYLIEAGANVDVPTERMRDDIVYPDDFVFGRTPLHIAADRGYHEMAQRLFATGADIDREDELGHRPRDAMGIGFDTGVSKDGKLDL